MKQLPDFFNESYNLLLNICGFIANIAKNVFYVYRKHHRRLVEQDFYNLSKKIRFLVPVRQTCIVYPLCQLQMKSANKTPFYFYFLYSTEYPSQSLERKHKKSTKPSHRDLTIQILNKRFRKHINPPQSYEPGFAVLY